MLELVQTPNGIRIEYPMGEVFKITLRSNNKFKEDTMVGIEISPNGTTPLVSRKYIPHDNEVVIFLEEEDTKKLLVSRTHVYKISLISGSNMTTVISGNIKIK